SFPLLVSSAACSYDLSLRDALPILLIVYVSSYEQYLMQLFEVEPFRFLKKPLQREQLEDVFLKAQKRIEEKQKSYYRFQFGKTVDRKSTRLNSSHVSTSYAVFCLKK